MGFAPPFAALGPWLWGFFCWPVGVLLWLLLLFLSFRLPSLLVVCRVLLLPSFPWLRGLCWSLPRGRVRVTLGVRLWCAPSAVLLSCAALRVSLLRLVLRWLLRFVLRWLRVRLSPCSAVLVGLVGCAVGSSAVSPSSRLPLRLSLLLFPSNPLSLPALAGWAW